MRDPLSDSEIIRRISEGDEAQYSLLIERYQRQVFRIVARHVSPEAVAEVAHATFVSAYRSLRSLKEPERFGAWIGTLAVRRSHDFWRAAHRKRSEVPMSALSESQVAQLDGVCVADRHDAEADSGRREAARVLLDEVLDTLSADDRMVVTLLHLEDRPMKEVAHMLGWSLTKTKVRAYRARRRLKDALGQIGVTGV